MPQPGAVDPTPLTRAQLHALAAAAARELSWGLHAASRELRGWRRMARAIPAGPLREDALDSLERKRGHAYGAALFAILPRRREPRLVRLLVAYETLVDFLDNVSERHPERANGERLHHALLDALDPARPRIDCYALHPWRDDGGYLDALVETCRAGCRELAAFDRVRPGLQRAARRALVLGVNHEPDPARRDAALRAWAARECRDASELGWFERSGAASATLVTHALLTTAADSRACERTAAAVEAAYWPWSSLATTMLDSYVDQSDDAARAHHSYIAHYGAPEAALRRLREALARAFADARRLPDGERHVVILASMAAMYLSKRSARAAPLRATTRELADAGGSLVRLLLPVQRAWRLAYRQRSA